MNVLTVWVMVALLSNGGITIDDIISKEECMRVAKILVDSHNSVRHVNCVPVLKYK